MCLCLCCSDLQARLQALHVHRSSCSLAGRFLLLLFHSCYHHQVYPWPSTSESARSSSQCAVRCLLHNTRQPNSRSWAATRYCQPSWQHWCSPSVRGSGHNRYNFCRGVTVLPISYYWLYMLKHCDQLKNLNVQCQLIMTWHNFLKFHLTRISQIFIIFWTI